MTDRRGFLFSSAAAAAAAALPSQSIERVYVEPAAGEGFKLRLAACELSRGLRKLGYSAEFGSGTASDLRFCFALEPGGQPESYRIARAGKCVRLIASTAQALLYAVFDFLERQGAFLTAKVTRSTGLPRWCCRRKINPGRRRHVFGCGVCCPGRTF